MTLFIYEASNLEASILLNERMALYYDYINAIII